MKKNISFEVIIITQKERQSLLQDCLFSLEQSLKKSKLHSINIYIVLNGSFEKNPKLTHGSEINLHFINQSIPIFPSSARNLALKLCKKDYVLILDDDIQLPENYFSSSLNFLIKRPHVLGGPDAPISDEKGFQQLFSLALCSPLTFGPTHKRHQYSPDQKNEFIQGDESNLILCHMWFKREIFEEFQFSEELFRNEENLLLWELKKAGKVIEYNASLFVHHHRKDSFHKVYRTYLLSGFSRVRSFFLKPKSFNLLYLLPLFGLLGLVFFPKVFSFLLLFYFFLLFAESLMVSIKYLKTYNVFQLTLIKTLVLWSYMSGSLFGVIFCLLNLPLKFARKQFGRFKENTI